MSILSQAIDRARAGEKVSATTGKVSLGQAIQNAKTAQQEREDEQARREAELRQAVLRNTTSLLDRTGPSYQGSTPLAQAMEQREAERAKLAAARQKVEGNNILSTQRTQANPIQAEARRQEDLTNLVLNRMEMDDLVSLRDNLRDRASELDPALNPVEYNQTAKRGQMVDSVLDQRYRADYENAPFTWKAGQNLGYVTNRAAAGLLGAVEGLGDAGATMLADSRYRFLPSVGLVQGISGLLGEGDTLKETAEYALSHSPTNDYRRSIEERYTPGAIARGVGELADTVTNMAPSIAANVLLPGAGLPLMAAQAGGSAAQDAYQNGATLEQAATYGTASGALEAGTEMLFGGLAGLGRGVLDSSVGSVVNQAINRLGGTKAGQVMSGLAQNSLVRALADSAGEGVEEVISTALSPYLQRAIYDPDAENATAEELIQSALLGAAAGGVFQGLGAIARRAGVNAGDNSPRETATMRREDRGMLVPGPLEQGTQVEAPQTASEGQNNTASTGETVVANTSLFDRGVLKNFNDARKKLISYAREHFPSSVRNRDTGKTIGISRNGLDKFLSGNIYYEKYASGFHIPELIERAHKVADAGNYHEETAGDIPTYEYYDSPMTIDGREYTAHIRVRNTLVGDRYYGHTVSQVENIEIEPSTRASTPENPAVQSVKIDGSIERPTDTGSNGNGTVAPAHNAQSVPPSGPSNNSIPQSGQNVNPGRVVLPTADNPNLLGGDSYGENIVNPTNGLPYVSTKTYRTVASGESPISGYTGYGMFADDPNSIDMYGESLYSVDNSSLPSINQFKEAIAAAWNEDVENGMLPPSIESLTDNFTAEEISETFDPKDIVDSADAWDDPDLITWAFEKGIFDEVPGVKTSDGAVVWDDNVIHTSDKNSDIIGLDQVAREGTIRAEGSTGAAPYGFDPYSNMLNEYGAIPEGENPARVVDVPVSTNGNDRVSRAARTVMEAEATPESMLGEVAEAITRGDLSHDVVTDKAATARARRTVENKGWAGALEEFHQAARSGRLSKNNVALGQVLLNNAMNAGDSQMAIDLLVDYASLATAAGQTLQAQRMLKKLTPEGQLYGIQRSVSNIQEELQRKYRDKAPDLEIPEELIEKFRNATDQDGRDAATEEIYQNIASQVPSTWVDKWNAWRYMAMLTNPRTHIRNIVGNAGFVPVRMMKDAIATTLEAGADLILPGGIQRTKAPLNLLSKADRDLVRASFSDVNNVQNQLLGSGKYADSATGKIEDYRTIFKFKPLEAVRKGNSNLMEVEDAWFSKSAYAGALAGYLKANGVNARQISDGTVSQEILDAGREYAIQEAQKATYRDANALSDFVSGLRYSGSNSVGRAANTLIEGVLPFRRTPANILARGMEYSPVGLIKGLTYDLAQVHNGNKTAAEAIDSISAGLTGTGLVALGAWLASMGLITGGGSGDDEQNAQNDLTGKQSYALSIGGKNYTLDWLAPEALPFFVGVEAYNVMSDKAEGGVTLDNILSAAERITDPMLEMSMLQGVQDAIETVQYADGGTLPKVAANAALSYLTQGIPTLFGQIERTIEDQRYTTFMDRTNGIPTDLQYTVGQAMNKLPGEFQQIPYIDAWGRTESTGSLAERAFNNFINPAYSSTELETDADRELQRLYDAGQTGVFPDRTAQSQKVDGQYLTSDQYVQYATTKGQTSYDIVSEMIGSDLYQDMTDEQKADAIKTAYQYAGHIAAEEVSTSHEADSYVEAAKNAQKDMGISTAEYLLLYDTYGKSGVDRIKKMMDAGTDLDAAIEATTSIDGLEPETGEDDVSDLQKYRAVIDSISNVDQQMSALSSVMNESTYTKVSVGYDFGVSPNAYVTVKEIMPQFDEPNDKGNLGTYTQEEYEAALDSLSGGSPILPGDTRVNLTNDQKAVLWQLLTGSKSAKNNPYSRSIGQQVIDALESAKGQKDNTSQSYRGLLNLPMA
jgi:hypothetical protein